MSKTTKPKPKAKPVTAWAAIYYSKRAAYTDVWTIRGTHREAKAAFLVNMIESAQKLWLANYGKTWTVRKVRVEEV